MSSWPPTKEQIESIAQSALQQYDSNNFKVLVYWENNPDLMIFDPVHYADTDYIRRTF